MRKRTGTTHVLCLTLSLLGFLLAAHARSDLFTDQTKTLTRVGQQIPPFTVTTLDGTTLNIAELKGKVILVNFWATWCKPCLYEMPLLEKEIWQEYRSPEFVMVAIAREQSEEEIASFRKEHGFSFPMAADPRKDIYNLFASEGIPRTYLASPAGKILFQSAGFSSEDFKRLKNMVKREVTKARKEGQTR